MTAHHCHISHYDRILKKWDSLSHLQLGQLSFPALLAAVDTRVEHSCAFTLTSSLSVCFDLSSTRQPGPSPFSSLYYPGSGKFKGSPLSQEGLASAVCSRWSFHFGSGTLAYGPTDRPTHYTTERTSLLLFSASSRILYSRILLLPSPLYIVEHFKQSQAKTPSDQKQ